MTEEAASPAYRIVTLRPDYGASGRVLDLLARHSPFAESPLAKTAKAIAGQLRHGRNVAAISPQGRLLAYAGWIGCRRADAELWVDNRGPLRVAERGGDAFALTIVVSTQASVTKALLRRAREMNPDTLWYFKRDYSALGRPSRKQRVVNRAGQREDSGGV